MSCTTCQHRVDIRLLLAAAVALAIVAAGCGGDEPLTLEEAVPLIEAECSDLRDSVLLPTLDARLTEFAVQIEAAALLATGEGVAFPPENLLAVLDREALARTSAALESFARDIVRIDTDTDLDAALAGPARAVADALEPIGERLGSFDIEPDLDVGAVTESMTAALDDLDAGIEAVGVPDCLRRSTLERRRDEAVAGLERWTALIQPSGSLSEDLAGACLRLQVDAADIALERQFSANSADIASALAGMAAGGSLRRFLADIERFALDPADLAEVTDAVDALDQALDDFADASLAEQAADSIPAAGDPDDAVRASAASAVVAAEAAFYETIEALEPRCG